MLICVALSIVSILPQVQDELPKSGLFQSGLITLYMLYLTWSSMSNNPDAICNPALSGHNVTKTDTENTTTNPDPMDSTSIIGLVIWFLCLLYLSISSSKFLSQDNGASGGGGYAENSGQLVWDNEEDGVAYSWSLFHLTSAFATLYAMMTLTNWFDPSDSDISSFMANTAAVWVKIVSSWGGAAIYVLTMLEPIIATRSWRRWEASQNNNY